MITGRKKPELLIPASSLEVLKVAILYGADAVYIGGEMPVASMRDCSVVTATYDLGDGMKGTVGIIGPRRMDYERVIDVLRHMMEQLDDLYKQ